MPLTLPWPRTIVGVLALVLLNWTGVSAQPLNVSPTTGYLTFTQRDHDLVTPLGRIPFTRSYVQSGPRDATWSLDMVGTLETVGRSALILRQGTDASLFTRAAGADVMESADGGRAVLRGGEYLVEFPDGAVRRFDGKGRELSRTDANGNALRFTWDAQGRLQTVRGIEARPVTISWAANGTMSSVADGSGRQARYEYDAGKRLVRATDADGWKTVYEWDAAGRIAALGLPDGETVRLAYDAQGRVVEQRSTRHPQLTYTYTATVTRVTRHDGYWRETVFDARHRPVEARDSTGRSERWTWDEQGRIATHTLPDGSTRRCAYDALGRTVTDTSSSGNSLQLAYDGRARRPASVTLNGATTSYAYDARGNLLSITSPAGRVERFAYDTLGRVTSQADGEGRTTRYEYDTTGALVTQVNADGGVQSLAYDAAGRVTRSVDPAGGVTVTEYDARGLRVATAGPDGVRSTVRFDAVGRPLAESSAGKTFVYSYDPAGRLAGIRYPGGVSSSLGYDGLGRPTAWTDPLGGVTRKEYDQLGRLVKTTGPGGIVATSTHDAAGRLSAIGRGQASGGFSVGPDGRTIRFTAPGGGETRMVTDAFGRVVERTLPSGGVERRTYDADGLLQSVMLPAGDTWRVSYDRSGLLTETRSPDGTVERRSYDAMGRLAGMVLPWGGTLSWRYDTRGLLVEQANARGEKVAYEYDQAGRVTRKRTPQDTWTYSYDANGNLVQASNGRFTTRHTYDSLSRLIATDYPEWQQKVAYQYDAHDRVVSRIGPGSAALRYSYDAIGRLGGVVNEKGESFSFAYDAEGRLTERRAPNGTVTTFAYDTPGRTTGITHKDASGRAIASRRYTFDAAGMLAAFEDEAGRRTTLEYDADGRLTGEQAAASKSVVAYGPAGNRLSTSGRTGSDAYAYDNGGRLTQAGAAAFTYDADGNVVSRTDTSGTTRYAYDAENNLVRADLPGGQSVAYGYGPLGERISRRQGEATTRYLLDSQGTLAELADDGRARATFLSIGLDETVLVSSPDGRAQLLHEDALGGVIAVTDTNGRVVARHDQDAFGNALQPPDSTVRFAGRPMDPATGLYDMRARFYDPRLGRFLSRDPEPGEPGNPLSFPAYVYAANNPVRYADPFGAAFYLHGRHAVRWYTEEYELGRNPDAELYRIYMDPRDAPNSPGWQIGQDVLMDKYRHNGEVIRRAIGETAARDWRHRLVSEHNQWVEAYNRDVGVEVVRPFHPDAGPANPTRPVVQPGAPASPQPAAVRSSGSAATPGSATVRTPSPPGRAAAAGAAARRAARVAGAAVAGMLAIGAADLFAETYDVNTGLQDGAWQTIKDRAANAASTAVGALPIMAGGAALGVLAPATVPVMAGLAAVGLTGLAAERAWTAHSEIRGYGVAVGAEREILLQQENNAQLRRLRQDFDEILAGVRAKLDQLDALRSEAQAAFDEIKQAELDAANAAEAFNTAHRQVQEALTEVDGALARFKARLESDAADAVDPAEAERLMKTLGELKAKACGIPQLVAAASAENQQNLVREAARLADQAAAATQAATNSQAAAPLEAEIAAQKDALSRAEGVWRERGNGRTSISSRLTIIDGHLATMRRAVALQAEIVSECGRLRLLTDAVAEVDAVRQQAYAAVPPVAEAEALRGAVQARLDDVAGRQAAMDAMLQVLTALWSELEQAQRERVASRSTTAPAAALELARQARECADRAAAIASPRPAEARPTGQPTGTPPPDARENTTDPAEGASPVKEQGGFKYFGDETRRDPGALNLLGLGTQDTSASQGGVKQQQGGVKQQGGFTYFGADTQPVRQATGGGSSTGWHVFATGSRLGWAGGLGRYSVGPADASIVEHLQAAGEHARMANQESRAPMIAWPGWAQMRESFRGWAANLQGNPSNNVRRQIAVSTSGNISGYAQVLNYQTPGIASGNNCEFFYVRIGFYLGYGSQVMQIADEAVRNGDRRAAQEPRADAISHLNTVTSILNDYDRVVLPSGSCADLREVRTLLQQLFAVNANDVSAQAVTATRAWETANRLIASFRGPIGIQRAAPVVPATKTPPSPPAPAQSPRAPVATPATPAVDEGELAGEWTLCCTNRGSYFSSIDRAAVAAGKHSAAYDDRIARRALEIDRNPAASRIIVTRNGNDYVGVLRPGSSLHELDDPFNQSPPSGFRPHRMYQEGQTLFKLTRTGPGTYEGQFFFLKGAVWEWQNWLPTTVRVEGNVMHQTGEGEPYGYPGNPITWSWIRK